MFSTLHSTIGTRCVIETWVNFVIIELCIFSHTVGNPTVDYFSLDVEGTELPIQQTIPWSNVTINTMTVEFNNRQDDKKAIIKLLEGEGYIFIKDMNHQDLVFVHKRLQTNIDDWVQNNFIS